MTQWEHHGLVFLQLDTKDKYAVLLAIKDRRCLGAYEIGHRPGQTLKLMPISRRLVWLHSN